VNKLTIVDYLKNKKDEFYKLYGITSLGLYGSYARDVDIFYQRDSSFQLK